MYIANRIQGSETLIMSRSGGVGHDFFYQCIPRSSERATSNKRMKQNSIAFEAEVICLKGHNAAWHTLRMLEMIAELD